MSNNDWKARANQVITARNEEEVRAGYDAWAEQYDADHVNFGLLLLVHFVALFCRYVSPGSGPMLDAGAGTGRLGEVLARHGYGDLTGIDLSPGMLEIASRKPGYTSTHVMRLGDALDFAEGQFATVVSLGAFAPNLAGKEAFDELIRVTRPGGLLVLSMRAGHERETGFDQRRNQLQAEGRWELVDQVSEFRSHPEIDLSMRYAIYAYRKTES